MVRYLGLSNVKYVENDYKNSVTNLYFMIHYHKVYLPFTRIIMLGQNKRNMILFKKTINKSAVIYCKNNLIKCNREVHPMVPYQSITCLFIFCIMLFVIVKYLMLFWLNYKSKSVKKCFFLLGMLFNTNIAQ